MAGPLVRLACARHQQDRAREGAADFPYHFDADRASYVIAFYETVLHLPDVLDDEGQPAPFLLQPWQAFIVGSLFGWVDDRGLRRFREAYIEIGKGNGKALALDTPIPTPTGWTTMGAIQPGDYVFDEHGQPTRVAGAFDVMHGHQCYEVVFDDQSSIVADADHLWWTEMRRSTHGHVGAALKGVPLAERGQWRRGIRTTQQIADTLHYANGPHQSANHSIPLAGPLGTTAVPLPIEPYLLGVWLGDGDSDCARITVCDADAELVEHLTEAGASVGDRKQSIVHVRTPRYRVGGLQAPLRAAGLLNNKHVPPAYFRASIEQRLALLQGLMDTDGYISPKTGACEFCTTTKGLADAARELIVSLGIKVVVRESAAKIAGREVSRRYRLQFHPPPGLPVFRLARKLAHQTERHARRRLSADRRIVDVRPVPSVPVRCIAVESPSHLYLAGASMVPTHNTPLCAGIGLFGLMEDGERAAEVYAAAADQSQAQILFRDAVRIVEASPDLAALLKTSGGEHIWQLDHKPSLSFFKTFSRESGAKSGTRPHMALLDELHEHGTPQISIKIRAGAKRRLQPLFVEITNSGFDRSSICWQHHEHSRKVVEGAVGDDQWFAYVCGLDDDDDPMVDEACWPKANPNYGVSVTADYLRRQVATAKNMPAEANYVLRLNFCVWTQADTRAIDMRLWAKCPPMPSDDELMLAPCYGGLDLGQTDDFSAWARVWRLDDGRVAAKLRYWIPEVAKQKYPDRPYAAWPQLSITGGDATDYRVVEDVIAEDCRVDAVRDVAYDKRFAEQMAQNLLGQNVQMINTPQGWPLNEALRKLLELVVEGKLCHGNDPVLMWMAANTVVLSERKGELYRIAKERASDKIDGIAALVMAIDRMIRQPVEAVSVYETRGLSVV